MVNTVGSGHSLVTFDRGARKAVSYYTKMSKRAVVSNDYEVAEVSRCKFNLSKKDSDRLAGERLLNVRIIPRTQVDRNRLGEPAWDLEVRLVGLYRGLTHLETGKGRGNPSLELACLAEAASSLITAPRTSNGDRHTCKRAGDCHFGSNVNAASRGCRTAINQILETLVIHESFSEEFLGR